MNPNDAIRLSLLAGEIMLSCGAETYRVEDTMRRILSNCGFSNSDAFVVSTGIFVSLTSEGGSITSVKRVKKRSYDIDKLIQVNDISRAFAEGRIGVDEATTKVEEVRSLSNHNAYPFIKLFASGFTCGGFTYMFGGVLSDCINAFITGMILQILLLQLRKGRVSEVLVNIIGGAVISFLTLTIMNLGVGKTLHYGIIGSLMLLVPGLTLTNAVRDVLEGDYLSGGARLMDALIVALSIACGVGTMLKLWIYIFGGVNI